MPVLADTRAPGLTWRPTPAAESALQAAFYLLCAALYVLRIPDSYLNPQFLIEDSAIFFQQNHTLGLDAILTPYAGYLHLLPRLFALAGDLLPTIALPTYYALSALAFFLLLVRLVLDRRVALPCRHALALALVLTPHTAEVFGTITNCHWLAPFGLLAILFTRSAPVTHWGRAGELLFVAVMALTGPFLLLMTPFFVLKALLLLKPRWFRLFGCFPEYREARHHLAMTGIAAAGAAVQAWYIVHNRKVIQYEDAAAPFNFFDLVLFRTFTSMVTGKVEVVPATAVPLLGGALLLGLILWTYIREPVRRFPLAVLGGYGLALIASVYLSFHNNLIVIGVVYNGDRYFYIPKVALAWMLIACLAKARWALPLLLIPTLAQPYQRPPMLELHWPFWSRLIDRGVITMAPFNGGAGTIWPVRFPGRPLAPKEIPEGWDEADYLRRNLDVAEAVAQNRADSGYAHYQQWGLLEGRKGGLPHNR